MADAEQAAPDNGGKQSEDAKSPSISDLMGMISELQKAQSGSDRKVVELSQALTKEREEKETLEKERMSDKERAAFEQKKQQDRIAAAEAKLADRELALEKANVIQELAVPKDLAPFVAGKDREDIMSNAKGLMKAFNDALLKEVNKRLVDSGGSPPAGDEPAGGFDKAAFERIMKMPPGPDKNKAMDAFYEGAFGGQGIPIMGAG